MGVWICVLDKWVWQRKNENTKNRGKETHLTLKIDSGGTREIAFIIRLLQGRRWLGAHHKERKAFAVSANRSTAGPPAPAMQRTDTGESSGRRKAADRRRK